MKADQVLSQDPQNENIRGGIEGQRVGVTFRLERLPISNYHRLVCFGLFVSWFCEAIDLGGMSFLMPIIVKDFKLTAVEGGYVASVAFMGMLFGALFAGVLSDIVGRMKVICASMITWGIAGFMLSQQHTVGGLYAWRFVLGLGMGAQIPVAMTYLSEVIPSAYRGRYLSLYQVLLPAGIAFAGLLTVLVLPAYGWRGCFVAEAVPALSVIFIYMWSPESALWLESRGRYEDADKIASLWEEKVEHATGQPLPPLASHALNKPAAKPGKITDLISAKYWKILVMSVVWYGCTMMSDYGLATWLTTLLISKGFDIIKSTTFMSLSVLGGLPAVFMVMWAVERIGRKYTVILCAGMTAVFAYLYGMSSSVMMVIVAGAFYQFAKYALAMVNNVYTPELFETHLRATGSGFALACGRGGSIVGPIFLAWVMTVFGADAVFFAAAGLTVLVGLSVLVLGPETKGKVFNA